jgi:hypothetical protein
MFFRVSFSADVTLIDSDESTSRSIAFPFVSSISRMSVCPRWRLVETQPGAAKRVVDHSHT